MSEITWVKVFSPEDIAVPRRDMDWKRQGNPIRIDPSLDHDSHELSCSTRIYLNLPHWPATRLPALTSIEVVFRFKEEE